MSIRFVVISGFSIELSALITSADKEMKIYLQSYFYDSALLGQSSVPGKRFLPSFCSRILVIPSPQIVPVSTNDIYPIIYNPLMAPYDVASSVV